MSAYKCSREMITHIKFSLLSMALNFMWPPWGLWMKWACAIMLYSFFIVWASYFPRPMVHGIVSLPWSNCVNMTWRDTPILDIGKNLGHSRTDEDNGYGASLFLPTHGGRTDLRVEMNLISKINYCQCYRVWVMNPLLVMLLL